MAQIYAAPRAAVVPPAAGAEQSTGTPSTSVPVEDAAVDFAHKRDALLTSIDATGKLVSSLSGLNNDRWTIHYPHDKLGFADSSSSSSGADGLSSPARLASLRRAASMYNEGASTSTTHAATSSAPATPSPLRPGLHSRAFSSIVPGVGAARSATEDAANINGRGDDDPDGTAGWQGQAGSAPAMRTYNPLAIDLRVGAPGSTSIPALMEQMSQATIAQLLSSRFDAAGKQLDSLRARVKDNQSKILVTGDLNAGKSTFVNALLRRNLLPTDQQPLTTVFCEVQDAQAYNNGKQEVHAILPPHLDDYSRDNSATYEAFEIDDLEKLATVDPEDQKYALLKVYVEDSRAPVDSAVDSVLNGETTAQEEVVHNKSFIRNGIVSISLIDGPGLNKDGLSTTAIFARQTEIDVVVFVVDAHNHFTLSSKDFIWNAAMEKAYIFIVVNKFGSLRNKDKCLKAVGDKIRMMSPRTWEQRDELVHWVEAGDVLKTVQAIEAGNLQPENAKKDEAFTHLEDSLRTFLMQKRTISKLTPAKHYLLNLLNSLEAVAEANEAAASGQFDEAAERLEVIRPLHEKLERERNVVEEAVGKEEDDVVRMVKKGSKAVLEDAVSFIGGKENVTLVNNLPEYPGLLDIWTWASTVKDTFVQYLETQIVRAEENARQSTMQGVSVVSGDLAKRFLPEHNAPGTTASVSGAAMAIPQRAFKPEVMFRKSRERRAAAYRQMRQQAQSPAKAQPALSMMPSIEITPWDFLDIDRLISLPTSLLQWQSRAISKKTQALIPHNPLVEATSALSVVSLGAGALTMFGSRVIGLKGFIEAITTAFEVLGSKAARKWAAPLAGLLTVAIAVYVVHDLPRAIPHNVGKKLHRSLLESEFSAIESERIASEARKVMRLAGWDLRERFRAALEASETDKRNVEDKLRNAEDALSFLENYLAQVDHQRAEVLSVEL